MNGQSNAVHGIVDCFQTHLIITCIVCTRTCPVLFSAASSNLYALEQALINGVYLTLSYKAFPLASTWQCMYKNNSIDCVQRIIGQCVGVCVCAHCPCQPSTNMGFITAVSDLTMKLIHCVVWFKMFIFGYTVSCLSFVFCIFRELYMRSTSVAVCIGPLVIEGSCSVCALSSHCVCMTTFWFGCYQ